MDVVEVGIVHGSLPSFRLHGGGGALRAAIIHYEANSRGTGYNEVDCMSILIGCPKGVPRSSLYRRLDLGLQGDCVSSKYTES